MIRGWKEMADGFALFAAYKVMTITLDIVTEPVAWSSPTAFIAGASAVAALLFVDYYIMETTDA